MAEEFDELDDHSEDSGLFELQSMVASNTSVFGRREDDKAWIVFLEKGWYPHRHQFKRLVKQVNDLNKQLNEAKTQMIVINTNQQQVLRALWGEPKDREEHKLAGLMGTKEKVDNILLYIFCPTWRFTLRIGIVLLAVWGGQDVVQVLMQILGLG